MLGLHCNVWAFSSWGEWGLFFLWWSGFSLRWLLLFQSTGSRCAASAVVAHGLSCSIACGIVPGQGSNQCPLHCKANSNHWTASKALLKHFKLKPKHSEISPINIQEESLRGLSVNVTIIASWHLTKWMSITTFLIMSFLGQKSFRLLAT